MADTRPINAVPPYFGDMLRKLFLQPLQISEEEVSRSLAGPLRIDQVKSNNMTLTLAISRATTEIPNSALLIQGELSSTAYSIEYVLRVPDALLAKVPGDAGPIDVLSALAGEYGFEFSIGNRRERFMKEQVVRIPSASSTPLPVVHSYPGAQYMHSTWISVFEKGEIKIAVCTLCFVLDAAAYQRAIGNQ